MLEAKLSPCASLLYQWVLLRVPTNDKIEIDLQDFQAWTGEFREKSYTYAEVFEALCQLKDFNLLKVSRTQVTLEAKISDRIVFSPHIESDSAAPSETKPANRWYSLGKILLFSTMLSLVSVGIGINLMKLQPQVLNTPHPWSALSGDEN